MKNCFYKLHNKNIYLCLFDSRHGTLGVAGKKINSMMISRKLFTDPMLPLSGAHSVVGKSLVLYDDHGPVARGERMACSM